MIDGNNLNYKGAVAHLWGIDAPDIGHVCANGWNAGKAAADYLRSLIATKPVACEPKASPMPGGPFAICKVDGQDLSAAMASAGMAWAAPNVADYSVQASYVERPLRQVLSQTMMSWEQCGHMSGLFARSKTAGLDEVRDTSG